MEQITIQEIAKRLVVEQRGILAADESTATITKRFAEYGIESTEEHRRAYRELLLTTSGMESYISGVILYDETIRQTTTEGVLFPVFLQAKGVIPGIKVDLGTAPLAGGRDGEVATIGLVGLAERVREYARMGAQFTKWRGVYMIGSDMPSDTCLHENNQSLAEYARIVQSIGLVPIVEPEVLMDGSHTIEQCDAVTRAVLTSLFVALRGAGVDLSGILLKPNMVIAGSEAVEQADVATVARMTVECLKDCVPADVPGIVFLSGGQSEDMACAHLKAMTQAYPDLPWTLSFSYGRALQQSALQTWGGDMKRRDFAQAEFLTRCKNASDAMRSV